MCNLTGTVYTSVLRDIDALIVEFSESLPGNPCGAPWSLDDIMSVIVNNITSRRFSPENPVDKVDLQYLLTIKYYNGMKISARIRVMELKRSTSLLQQISDPCTKF